MHKRYKLKTSQDYLIVVVIVGIMCGGVRAPSLLVVRTVHHRLSPLESNSNTVTLAEKTNDSRKKIKCSEQLSNESIAADESRRLIVGFEVCL